MAIESTDDIERIVKLLKQVRDTADMCVDDVEDGGSDAWISPRLDEIKRTVEQIKDACA